MGELLSIWIFFSSIAAAIAVVLTACSWSRCVTARMRALCLVAVNRPAHTLTLLTHTHRVWKSLSIDKYTVFKGAVWTFRTALSRRCVRVGTVEWRTRSSLTLYSAMLTSADVAGLIRGRKPLAVAIDTMVIGAAFTRCTAGASDLGGMLALGGGAVCVCAQGLSIHTGAAGARTLRLPVGAILIFHPMQHTCFADWTAEMWVYNRVGALDRRALLFMANDIPTLTPAL